MEKRLIAFVWLFELGVATNIASPAKIIAFEAHMAALLCLNGVITSKKRQYGQRTISS